VRLARRAVCDPPRGGCLLLDVRMPQMTGLQLQQQLNVRGWRIPVIFITGHGTVPLAIAAMKAGAFDFIEKPLREDSLLDTIERALDWNDRAYEERLERATLQVRAALLTSREREVFELVATGEPDKIIARRLGISFRTVELHRGYRVDPSRRAGIRNPCVDGPRFARTFCSWDGSGRLRSCVRP
jgi:two-component system, LuxR family, response regulator FixJ